MIGIGISFVLGGLIGWAADHFYNRGDKMVIHPMWEEFLAVGQYTL